MCVSKEGVVSKEGWGGSVVFVVGEQRKDCSEGPMSQTLGWGRAGTCAGIFIHGGH